MREEKEMTSKFSQVKQFILTSYTLIDLNTHDDYMGYRIFGDLAKYEKFIKFVYICK